MDSGSAELGSISLSLSFLLLTLVLSLGFLSHLSGVLALRSRSGLPSGLVLRLLVEDLILDRPTLSGRLDRLVRSLQSLGVHHGLTIVEEHIRLHTIDLTLGLAVLIEKRSDVVAGNFLDLVDLLGRVAHIGVVALLAVLAGLLASRQSQRLLPLRHRALRMDTSISIDRCDLILLRILVLSGVVDHHCEIDTLH